jgi:hypothetical protein
MTRALILCMAVFWAGCGETGADPDVTSETHWMQACADGDACGDQGVCLCGVCTLPCDSDTDCDAAGPLTSCVPAGAQALDLVCGDAVSASLCLAPCEGVDACGDVADGLSCSESHCLPPVAPASCAGNVDCGDGLCQKAAGTCLETDTEGMCVDRPEACTEEFDPVCGCDGQTHGNACSAQSAGVNIDHVGECEVAPTQCVGDDDCAAPEYCLFPEQDACGLLLEFPGVCSALPEGCDAVFEPVCGCDDVTYGNACEAAMMGRNVAAEGECAEPAQCGGFRGEQCDDGLYCHWTPDLMCGAGDQTGVCLAVPEVCTDENAPVCACDNNTYSNACEAHAESLSVLREGACE